MTMRCQGDALGDALGALAEMETTCLWRILTLIFPLPRIISQAGARCEHYLAGLDKLLVSGQITNQDYQQRIAELNSNYVARK